MASVADVCVMIPAFNAEQSVGRAVRSALAQAEAAEVIVIDDGSTDETAKAAHDACDGSGRLRIIRLPVSGGPAAARNRALTESASPWICPLDADDYFLEGRLAALRAQADDCDFVADDLLRTSEAQPDGPFAPLLRPRTATQTWLDFTTFVRGNISRAHRPRCELGFLKPLMRRAFLDQAGLRYPERLRLGEDFALYATALAQGGRFKLVPACGYVAIERADSLSGRHSCNDLKNLLAAGEAIERLGLERRERAALRAHRRHLAAKIKLREVIEVRRARGYAAAALSLAPSPHLAPYVVSRTLADMRGRSRLRGRRRRAAVRGVQTARVAEV